MSQQRNAANAAINGRGGRKAAYTGGARSVDSSKDNAQAMKNAWENNEKVDTYTRTRGGAMSTNGRTAGGSTWTFTPKNDDGSAVINPKTGEARQSGRSTLSSRRQRYYDARKGMNNISPRVIQAWLDNGMARVVDGSLVGQNGNVIRQKADGNYSMGLSVG